MQLPGDRLIRIGIIAGETSGDILGAGLLGALKKRYPSARFEGIGGPLMEEQGLDSWYPMETLSIMGLIEVLKHLPRLVELKKDLIKRWSDNPPDLFIGVDAPDFNLRIEAALHPLGIPTLHYVSPSVWAWRQGRIHGIKRCVDHMLTLLPFEARFYEDHQVPVTFVGHPMADQIPLEPRHEESRQQLYELISGKDGQPALDGKRLFAILPGSRQGEVGRLMPLFLEVIQEIRRRSPESVFVIPAVNAARETQIRSLLPDDAKDIYLVQGKARLCMAAADVALLASGTATLECMLVKTPMVVSYRLATLTYWLMRWLIKVPYVALPNLLAGRQLVPELLQHRAVPSLICDAMLKELEVGRRSELQERFRELHLAIRADADERAASAACALIQAGKN